MKIRIESNFNVSMLASVMNEKFLDLKVEDGGFGLVGSNIYNYSSNLYKSDLDVLIVFLNTDFLGGLTIFKDPFCDISVDLDQRIDNEINGIVSLLEAFHLRQPTIPIFLFTFPNQLFSPFNRMEVNSTYFSLNIIINKLNYKLVERINNLPNVFLIDINKCILEHGYRQIFDNRMLYLAMSPFSSLGLDCIANEIFACLKVLYSAPKKVLVLDLDNTLWGGVVGEEGVQGIQVALTGDGKAFWDFQNEILNLKKRGVLLALNSKNNIADVKEVFEHHPEMALSWSDFVVKKVNWNDKVSNMLEIAQELNVGTESFVFIDDSPTERAWVKSQLPDVLVPDFPSEPENLRDFLISIGCFDAFHITDEDFSKSQKYLNEINRKEFQNSCVSFEDFLTSLNMRVVIRKTRSEDINRCVQLTGKTNQFNFTGQRLNAQQINVLIQSPDSDIFSIFACDKFGDYGQVGLAVFRYLPNETVIDHFLLSCRVLGRKVEQYCLAYFNNMVKEKNLSHTLHVKYRQTKKNGLVVEFLSGMKTSFVADEDGNKLYAISNNCVKLPKHIEVPSEY